ncbi:MAG TPA: peptide ABC transporter substrate-binding protein, partial [Acetobacteraceae bacterium]|nr:peptide ABC transporter substrate-binding protein [Acetobacteraceae bacterium]
TDIIPSGGATAMLWTEMQQQDLRAVGIDMKIRQVTFNQLLALQYKPLEWQAMSFGWSLGNYPSDGAQFRTNGAYNQTGYSDPKMDRLLNAVTTQPGNQALYEYQDYAAEQQPIIFQNDTGAVILVRKGLRGVNKAFPPTGAWSPQYLRWTTPPCGHPAVAENAAP